MSITLETGTGMWLRLPPRMRKRVDEFEGIVWRLQRSVIIKFVINLAKELLVLVFDNDGPVLEGIVREIKGSPFGDPLFYLLIELLATSGPQGDVRLDWKRTLRVVECYSMSVKYDDRVLKLLQDLIVYSNSPCTWVPMFAQRVDNHRSANIAVLVLHISVRYVWNFLHGTSYCQSRLVEAALIYYSLASIGLCSCAGIVIPRDGLRCWSSSG